MNLFNESTEKTSTAAVSNTTNLQCYTIYNSVGVCSCCLDVLTLTTEPAIKTTKSTTEATPRE